MLQKILHNTEFLFNYKLCLVIFYHQTFKNYKVHHFFDKVYFEIFILEIFQNYFIGKIFFEKLLINNWLNL